MFLLAKIRRKEENFVNEMKTNKRNLWKFDKKRKILRNKFVVKKKHNLKLKKKILGKFWKKLN